MRPIRSKLTFSNVIALLALFVALGGSAYAVHLGKNAVKTKNIKNAAVTDAKIAPGAVSAGKLANGAVTADKLAPGAVRSPTVVVREGSAPLNDASNAIPVAHCQSGEVAVGGGAFTQAQGSDIELQNLQPILPSGAAARAGDTPAGFSANITNEGGTSPATTAFTEAICMTP
jgi:hypothetical protein